MADLRAAIVAEARTWVGTPYAHIQCLKGPGGGVDCAYLLLGVALAVGCLAPTFPRPVYSPAWHLHQRQERYREALEGAGFRPSAWAARAPGDVVLFRFGLAASHAGILLPEDTLIHARVGQRVLLQPIPSPWRARIVAVYLFPGVEPGGAP